MNIGSIYGSWSSVTVKTLEPALTIAAFAAYCNGSDINDFYSLYNNSHWRSGYEVGDGTVEAKGLNAGEMKNPDSFPSWDFDEVWIIENGQPKLRKREPVSAENYVKDIITNPPLYGVD